MNFANFTFQRVYGIIASSGKDKLKNPILSLYLFLNPKEYTELLCYTITLRFFHK